MPRVLLFLACAISAGASSWPWPWHHSNTTTTPAPGGADQFALGVAAALGFKDAEACFKDFNASVEEVYQGAEEYIHGGWVDKAKAITKFAEAMKDVTAALKPCGDVMTDAGRYRQLVKDLEDPKFYSVHNALTLAINLAEDRGELYLFVDAWRGGHYYAAGLTLTTTILDVIEHPGIPENNSTVSRQIIGGVVQGLASDVDLPCFVDARIEIPSLIGGVLDIVSVVKIVDGLESLFHGLEGLVPAMRDCMADKQDIMKMLDEFEDLKDPAQLAKDVAKNLERHGVDISIEATAAVLAFKGKEYERFGEQIGKLLGHIAIVGNDVETTLVPTVVV